MKKFYKDAYGCTASIKGNKDNGFTLVCRSQYGKVLKRKKYETFIGARIALGRLSDFWDEQ